MSAPLKSPSELRARYNPAFGLITGPVYGVGYHTRLPGGSEAHPHRENAVHAFALLASGAPADQAFGRELLARVLAAQDTDPVSPWYGLWSWFAEEPLPSMNPADWNWADFIGCSLIEILNHAADRLTPELAVATRTALGHAAWSIFRRNVTLDYTNIAILGSAVVLGAGQLLAEPRLTAYGGQRLHALRARIEKHGIAEYNSPNYYMGDIGDLERILHLPLDPSIHADASALLRLFWQNIAHHFHAPTGQWGGPHSRAYTDWLSPVSAGFLETRLGFPLPGRRHPPSASGGQDDPYVIPASAVPCPADLLTRFQTPPATAYEHREVWTRDDAGRPKAAGSTWFTPRLAFGSINQELAWKQCQPITAYWRGDDGAFGRLRVRVLLNGTDFCSARIHAAQRGPLLLGAIDFVPNGGTTHIHFDKPPGGVFTVRDLRVRIEVEGAAAQATQVSPTEWTLAAAGDVFTVGFGPAWFDGVPVTAHEPGRADESAWIDAILHTGAERDFHPVRAGLSALTFGIVHPGSGRGKLDSLDLREETSGYCAHAVVTDADPLTLRWTKLSA